MTYESRELQTTAVFRFMGEWNKFLYIRIMEYIVDSEKHFLKHIEWDGEIFTIEN